MKKLVICIVCLVVFLFSGRQASADIILSGETKPFTGSGAYSLSLFAESDSSEVLGGFNVTLDFNPTGFVFNSVDIAPEFDLPFSNFTGGNLLQIGGTSTAAPALDLSVRQVFATVNFTANSTGEMPLTIDGLFDTGFASLNGSVGSNPQLTAVPEPGTATFMFSILGGVLLRRRNKKS